MPRHPLPEPFERASIPSLIGSEVDRPVAGSHWESDMGRATQVHFLLGSSRAPKRSEQLRQEILEDLFVIVGSRDRVALDSQKDARVGRRDPRRILRCSCGWSTRSRRISRERARGPKRSRGCGVGMARLPNEIRSGVEEFVLAPHEIVAGADEGEATQLVTDARPHPGSPVQ